MCWTNECSPLFLCTLIIKYWLDLTSNPLEPTKGMHSIDGTIQCLRRVYTNILVYFAALFGQVFSISLVRGMLAPGELFVESGSVRWLAGALTHLVSLLWVRQHDFSLVGRSVIDTLHMLFCTAMIYGRVNGNLEANNGHLFGVD